MYKKITDNIYLIYVDMPYSPLKNLNAYVIKGRDRNLLIDTGDRRKQCLSSLREGLRELNVDMAQTDIFLTHMHTDHVGLLDDIATPETRVYMSNADIRCINSTRDRENDESLHSIMRLHGFRDSELERDAERKISVYFSGKFNDFIGFEDGARFAYGGYNFTAVSTPGHTPGHMCLYEEKEHILFSGDHVIFGITPNISSWEGVKDSLGDYIESLVKISAYKAELVLPAHRNIDGNLADRAFEIIQHHSDRVEETQSILKKAPDSTAYQLAAMMHWNIRSEGGWERFPLVQKVFAVNEIVAHLDYLICRDRALCEFQNGVMHYYPAPMISGQQGRLPDEVVCPRPV